MRKKTFWTIFNWCCAYSFTDTKNVLMPSKYD